MSEKADFYFPIIDTEHSTRLFEVCISPRLLYITHYDFSLHKTQAFTRSVQALKALELLQQHPNQSIHTNTLSFLHVVFWQKYLELFHWFFDAE